MNRAIVIGGGWAGLSSAVELQDKGFEVTLLEQSGRLGGRASSFKDKESGEILDNGQHLFMGCYSSTIRFLEKIGSLKDLRFQDKLSVNFVNRKGKIFNLNCPQIPAPYHLFFGLANLGTLSLVEKFSMLKVYGALKNGAQNLKTKTVEEWLIALGQSERARKYFWDLITIATLNEQPSIADAESLRIVLKEAFFSSKEKSKIALSTVGLSELCGSSTERYLQDRNSSIRTNVLVSKIEFEGDSVSGVILRDGTVLKADVYICAVPFFVLPNLVGEEFERKFFGKLKNLQSSPICSIALWFDEPVTDLRFAGLLDTQVQWFFNKSKILKSASKHLSLVISGAHQIITKSDQEILKLCMEELQDCFPKIKGFKLRRALIQREKNATLSPKIGAQEFRLPQKTPLKNFFLAGDWTDTGLPATIESAVLSGVKAVSYL
ncbi:MAG: hypothetical protein A3I11_09115 [Elusimicrobia bacterium RIFCSPLOWO2_02_FULL_39_32]|nr:MAG: hypothetical protein A3B80_01185 [Elusimicrobia bacterium RIFCSPHIGHO2_02_FULL_39_36]OGR93432.1 MAG: hypothetical protein A3I11_09115 [Elusimicrobia bacterium RIFCSPLOWO2_02_FULL_39_32]OGS00279.1 MAG: hypothetical protein A3G85_05555 [Elusimicrobia bacterium RIFCSPLOWO2_12_FULL_39_28]